MKDQACIRYRFIQHDSVGLCKICGHIEEVIPSEWNARDGISEVTTPSPSKILAGIKIIADSFEIKINSCNETINKKASRKLVSATIPLSGLYKDDICETERLISETFKDFHSSVKSFGTIVDVKGWPFPKRIQGDCWRWYKRNILGAPCNSSLLC